MNAHQLNHLKDRLAASVGGTVTVSADALGAAIAAIEAQDPAPGAVAAFEDMRAKAIKKASKVPPLGVVVKAALK